MALICQHCGRGIGYGHAVSHAKNRTRRIFKPNIQKLKVLKNGISVRLKLCTSCIQRLKKDKYLGQFRLIQYLQADQTVKEEMAKIVKKPTVESVKVEEEKRGEELKIEDIVGKK
ncbi:50S ribosomal protein L28 [Candidatus Gottesmanbacteria bacterium RIFCSPHIGHO2_02_FULL_39_14]|uniref:Large ribosomal subunit protein bL28 n=2 Tax=Candidatus Gottesmaniibacteriota TaxID=1752720 RepID=A0A1F5ZX15_9BACT|nr:MAG: 50S ribosomal protein L28 [Candidatus Gottesmanbacteria bacterium RIFCSPHIGHO2_02_FULL_39_14]